MTLTIRLAPPLDSYRAPWSHPAADDRERLEYCACGIYVVQHHGEPIPAVVRRHNDTPQHRAWRAERDR